MFILVYFIVLLIDPVSKYQIKMDIILILRILLVVLFGVIDTASR